MYDRNNPGADVSYGSRAEIRGFLMVIELAILMLLWMPIGCATGPVPVTGPARAPDPVDELLEKLERAADDLRDFSANIRYDKWDAVLERTEIRTGKVIYQVDQADGSKRFAILLERLIVGNRARNQRKHYIFDGSWLVEIDHDAKVFIKRQIVAPDKQFDPLKLGEGPFPLPIGQPKDEVLARFDVQRIDAPKEGLLKNLSDVYGLRLTPKPNTPEAEDFQRVDLFYDRQTLLPTGINVLEVNGDHKTVRLRNLRRNQGVDEDKLSIKTPDPKQGWHIDVRPWRPQ